MFSALGVPPSLSLLLPLLVLACAPVEESPAPAAVRPLPAAVATTPPAVEWIWADGPVAWGEWSDANLARAQREDRPLLVYFAAPGCEGLFPDPTPALRQLVEEVFVGVRVDPFARPDIARHYDAGGWPALVAALPDGRVFARAVDIPPPNVEMYLRRLAAAFADKREVVVDKVRGATARRETPAPLDVAAVYRVCAAAFDSVHGGFGGPTKFLEAPVLRFLLAYADARGEERARRMVRCSLDAILASPLQEAGGFRAFSHAPDWRAPADERDALDQAAMLHLLLEAGESRRSAARALFDFIARDLFAAGHFRGRQVAVGTGWWTDSALYADRQAALIGACLVADEVLGEGRALDMALQAGDILIARCIDGDGRVRHVCGGEGAGIAGLLEDQAAAALALWALSERSGASHFTRAAARVTDFLERHLGGDTAFYGRVAGAGPLVRGFSHRDDGRPSGNAQVLEFYGRRGDAGRLAALAKEGLRRAPSRAYSSWARAVLYYGRAL